MEDVPTEGALMTTKKKAEKLPRPADELEELAAHYGDHDTVEEMDHGEWVDPRPMKTTSLRLPMEVVEALKTLAASRGVRYTALVREMLEQALVVEEGAPSHELARLEDRLKRIEQAMLQRHKGTRRAVGLRERAVRRHRERVRRGRQRTAC